MSPWTSGGPPNDGSLALRYYSPHPYPDTEALIRELLDDLALRHRIPIEVEVIRRWMGRFGLQYSKEQQQSLYLREFLPRSQVLRTRVGATAAQLIRDRRGRYHVAGVVVLLRNGRVTWAPTSKWVQSSLGRPPLVHTRAEEDPGAYFLLRLLQDGPAMLRSLVEPPALADAQRDVEGILSTLRQKGLMVGGPREERLLGGRSYLIVDEGIDPFGTTWLVREVPVFTYAVLRQALRARTQFVARQRKKNVRLALLYRAPEPVPTKGFAIPTPAPDADRPPGGPRVSNTDLWRVRIV